MLNFAAHSMMRLNFFRHAYTETLERLRREYIRLHRHQERAIAKAQRGESFIVTTGKAADRRKAAIAYVAHDY
jgi:hypothetical protein